MDRSFLRYLGEVRRVILGSKPATRPTENVGEFQADYLFEKFRRSDYLKSVVHLDQL